MKSETKFDPKNIKNLFKPDGSPENGQVTIIGGSTLFHGAPIFSLITASRIVDMVFFTSPEKSIESVVSKIKSKLLSFIWVPWDEVYDYISKSDAILIGPGLMRYRSEKKENTDPNSYDEVSEFTKEITKSLLAKFPNKRWVIDAGSLQILEKDWIPEGSILTPNKKEYLRLFGDMDVSEASLQYKCTIVLKGIVDKICSYGSCVLVEGGNAGLSKGGTGDTLAGLTVALYAKNSAEDSASVASYILKRAGDELYSKVKTNFNADDLARKVPEILASLQK